MEAERQWRLAIRQSALLARTFSEASIVSVIDVYAPPSRDPNDWDMELAGVDARTVYLFPSFDVCVDRNRGREAPLTEADLQRNYDDFAWSIRDAKPANILRNDSMTVPDAVAAIQALIDR